jgi:hypothetical protein
VLPFDEFASVERHACPVLNRPRERPYRFCMSPQTWVEIARKIDRQSARVRGGFVVCDVLLSRNNRNGEAKVRPGQTYAGYSTWRRGVVAHARVAGDPLYGVANAEDAGVGPFSTLISTAQVGPFCVLITSPGAARRSSHPRWR